MAEDISIPPLLALVKERELVDDLQYEEVLAEFKRSGTPVMQILQDFGIMDSDNLLQVMADHLGTEVVSLSGRDLAPDLLRNLPGSAARMYQCLPVGMSNSTLQVALVDPLVPGVTVLESAVGSYRAVEVRDLYPIGDPAHPTRFLRLQVNQ